MYRNISLSLLLIILIASCGGNTQERDINGVHIFPVKDFKNGSWLGKVYYIDEKGNPLFDKAFDQASLFVDGVACVEWDGRHYFMDEKGNFLFNKEGYAEVYGISDGVGWVRKEIATYSPRTAIDMKNGNELFTVPYSDNLFKSMTFSEGLVISEKEYKCGFLNKQGEWVIQPEWGVNDICFRVFKNGMYCVYSDQKYGCINRKGELVIDYLFKRPFIFDSNGCAVVVLDDESGESSYGLIDKKGNYLIEPHLKDLEYDDGWYRFSVDGNLYGWCDKNGKIKIEAAFKSSGGVNINFFNGDKWTLVLGRYIDREGKVALETEYAPLGNFMGDVAFVQTRDGVALMNRKGELVGETRFRSRFNSLIQRLYSSGVSLVDYLNF